MLPSLRPALVATSLALLAGCYEVPVTGRKAMNIVSDADVTKISIAEFDALKARHPRSRDRAKIDQLQRVGERLARTVFWDMPLADWEFVVFDVPQINAFAMAGGKVGVFSGLWKIVDDDETLAAVIAHEIAHVTAKHVHERLSQELAAQTGGVLGSVAMLGSGLGSLPTAMALGVYEGRAGESLTAFDREKELEADLIGMRYMARAGFDPHGAIRVMERLEVEDAKQRTASPHASTHPSSPERVSQLNNELPKAMKAYEQSGLKQLPQIVR